MTALSVNLNKLALIRNSRTGALPHLTTMAERCLKAGAKGITIHPRPDQRHARYSDIAELKAVVDRFPGAELNIEGNPIPEFMDVVLAHKPHQVTLVPDDPDQLTSDHGYDLKGFAPQRFQELKNIVTHLKSAGIRVSIFLDADPAQIANAPETGTDRIELYTEPYALAYSTPERDSVLAQFARAVQQARALGLGVNAGHDLNLVNVRALAMAGPIDEMSIGHALIVESFDFGLEDTIRRYLTALHP